MATSTSQALAELEADYHLWLSELLPKHFRSAGPEQFAPHHEQFFDWGWKIRRGVLPNPPACLWMVNRGGNKSTSVAGLAVALGAMQRRKFGLVITRTETQGDTHIGRVNSMLLASNIGRIYPGMTRPQVRRLENRNIAASWNRTMLTTEYGWTLQNFSLEAAQRGVGIEEYRPDFIWITDVDDERDGPIRVETILNLISASILGTASSDCAVIFDQNLIHQGSVLNRIFIRETDVLSDRLAIGPVPAVYEPQYERRGNQWFIPEGVASWQGMPIEACEGILNRVGKDSWEREYQHDISQIVGRPRFNLEAIKEFGPKPPTNGELRLKTDDYGTESVAFYPAATGAFALWHRPMKGHRYAAGADTAEGIDILAGASSTRDPDYSALQIRDVDSGEQVARIRGRITEGPFGEMVYATLRWYNNAFLVPEVKGGYGRAMLNKLLELGYPEDLIWNRHMFNEIAGQPHHAGKVAYQDLGWNTSATNRPTLIDFLDNAITGHTIETYDDLTIQEYRHFCYGPRKPEAEPGHHDDLVISDCLCVAGIWLVQHRRPRRVGPPVIRYAGTGEPVEGQREDRDRVKDWQGRM